MAGLVGRWNDDAGGYYWGFAGSDVSDEWKSRVWKQGKEAVGHALANLTYYLILLFNTPRACGAARSLIFSGRMVGCT
jgi:hypothetical protein